MFSHKLHHLPRCFANKSSIFFKICQYTKLKDPSHNSTHLPCWYWWKTPWPRSTSHLYRSSDRHFSEKLVPTLCDRGCRMVSTTDPYGRMLSFLDRSRYFFFEVAPQLYSRGWVDPVPDPLLPRKSGSAGNRTQTSGFVARNSDH
jgi:hypothetical protein